ncbi:MAG TPA: hypothetical protein GXX73_12065 [Clostridium sp.]|nr:hypothetical protein [Clostridium sp.]
MHCIRCFIGKKDLMNVFVNNWVEAEIIDLSQGFSLVFLTDELYDGIEELVNSKLDVDYSEFFYYLSPSIYEVLVQESREGMIAYIETDYFGGVGRQSAILFENSKVKIEPLKTESFWDEKTYSYYRKPEGEKAINLVLKELGVYKQKEKDEFDSVGLGNFRRMD